MRALEASFYRNRGNILPSCSDDEFLVTAGDLEPTAIEIARETHSQH
jgi:hypothetical protein